MGTSVISKLNTSFNYLEELFGSIVSQSLSDFWEDDFEVKLLSISDETCFFFRGEDFFVTQIKIDKSRNVFLRLNADASEFFLNAALGPRETCFDMETLSELEAKILTTFNDYVYKNFLKLLTPINALSRKELKNDSQTHFTFFIRKFDFESVKLIISIPTILLPKKDEEIPEAKFSASTFKNTKCCANVVVGSTKISLSDLKQLSQEDIIVLENSNIRTLRIKSNVLNKTFNINPDPSLIMVSDDAHDNDEGENMDTSAENLWDNIQVEVEAEFEKVKITLGELKQISEGLVMDLGSVFKNKIMLAVEDKPIAQGELVIINDRYGVKIDTIFAEETQDEKENSTALTQQEQLTQEGEPEMSNEEDDFDYSDFELDDEEI